MDPSPDTERERDGVANGAAPVRVFLLDDHEIVRRGLRDLLGAEDGLEVVGEAETAAQALARVPALRPDVAVLDVRLPDGDGVRVCRDLRSTMPGLACLMLTSFSDDEALLDALLAGAGGYVIKQVRGADLVGAIRRLAAGGTLFEPGLTEAVTRRLRQSREPEPFEQLTPQELRVLDFIGDGLTNRQIAERMSLAEKTIKNYVSGLLAKLGVDRRVQAAVMVSEAHEHHGAASRRPDGPGHA